MLLVNVKEKKKRKKNEALKTAAYLSSLAGQQYAFRLYRCGMSIGKKYDNLGSRQHGGVGYVGLVFIGVKLASLCWLTCAHTYIDEDSKAQN